MRVRKIESLFCKRRKLCRKKNVSLRGPWFAERFFSENPGTLTVFLRSETEMLVDGRFSVALTAKQQISPLRFAPVGMTYIEEPFAG